MSQKDNDTDLEKFVSHDKETNISQCLVPECNTVFIGKKKSAIKRHYRIAHDADIEDYEDDLDMLNIHNNDIHNNIHIEGGKPCDYHSNSYLKGNTKPKMKLNSIPLYLEEKKYKAFRIADYVEYCKQTNVSTCLIKNCERRLSGRRTGNIKRHYQKVHNFIIVHDSQETIRVMDKELLMYYNNDTFGDTTFDEENDDEFSDGSENSPCIAINFEQYIDYDPLINKSVCKVPGCKTLLEGRKPFNIKRHYGLVHKYDIESNGSKVYNSKFLKIYNGSLQNTSIISVEDLVVYDKKSSSYQCLFSNCNDILEKDLPTLKRHYHEVHKIIMARFSDNVPQRFHRKRKHHGINNYYESEFSRDDDYVDETSSYLVKDELLSDDEHPHCSKRSNNNINYIKGIETCSEKMSIREDNQPKSKKIQITMTRQRFLKLCLDLVIERDLRVSLFDDEEIFKKLLNPVEQLFDFKVNSSLIENLLIKANNIVISGLKEEFANKIVCLELHIVTLMKIKYLIFNVRFLKEQIICNKIIGFLPITEANTSVLKIYDCLSKFNIEKQQIYVTTIIADFQDDEEINKICNDLCKHDPNIKKHPICHVQAALKSFLQNYSKDINKWQRLISYENKLNLNILNNLLEFANCVENFAATDSNLNDILKEAKLFLKTTQILRNFIEKLSEERYVAGDFYRDFLCCELELKGELTKNNNTYAGKMYEGLSECKNQLLEFCELTAALYLDARFNFRGSLLLSQAQKTKGKEFLCDIWEKYKSYIQSESDSVDPLLITGDRNDDSNNDEYSLLNQHINDIMPEKSNVCIEDMLNNCIPTKREPFSQDILRYWHDKRKDMNDINELTRIALTFSSSQYILIYLQKNFTGYNIDNDEFGKFLIKNNKIILEKNLDLILRDFK